MLKIFFYCREKFHLILKILNHFGDSDKEKERVKHPLTLLVINLPQLHLTKRICLALRFEVNSSINIINLIHFRAGVPEDSLLFLANDFVTD